MMDSTIFVLALPLLFVQASTQEPSEACLDSRHDSDVAADVLVQTQTKLTIDLPELDQVERSLSGYVSDLHSQGTEHVRNFTAESETMLQRVRQQWNDNKAALAKQRRDCEQDMNASNSRNDELMENISKTRRLLHAESARQAALRSSLQERIKEHNINRDSLASVDRRLGLAEQFVLDSLSLTDVSGAKELEVLKPLETTQHTRSSDENLEVLRNALSENASAGSPADEGLSLLQEDALNPALAQACTGKPCNATTQGMLDDLSRKMVALQNESARALSNLKSSCDTALKAFHDNYTALLADQASVIAEKAQIVKQNQDIDEALNALSPLEHELDDSFRAFHLFFNTTQNSIDTLIREI